MTEPITLPGWLILAASFGYLCVLFALAYWGDKQADRGYGPLLGNPYIYAFSIAVYCTSWTFYGSVGRAASSGLGFLPIYLGPTLTFALGLFVLRKILRISKAHAITSIADFISSRYGKSHLLGGLVTVIAVVGIMPYISLQLKAVSNSFDVLLHYPNLGAATGFHGTPVIGDTALYVTFVLTAFAILFGTRHIEATEHHQGMVAAVAFESVVKLVAFVAVGMFVTFGLFDGFGDIFSRAAAMPGVKKLMTLEPVGTGWASLTFLSMTAVICLPRQFQVTIVENNDESHLDKALWLFPLYLLLINIFVLPIAFGGLLLFPDGSVDADIFVLAIPMAEERPWLALLVFIGGLSASTAMVIVATIALSTMVCNDLIMPLLLRFAWLHLADREDLSALLLFIRRSAIIVILILGYLYFRLIGESYALVTIGLVSFAAAAQFAPVIVGGIFWKRGSRRGALAGLSSGFLMWAFTLVLPSLVRSGWLPDTIIDQGLMGIGLLKPYALFGLEGLDPISHSLFWTMLVNVGSYVAVSLFDRQSSTERIQATLFVEVYSQTGEIARHWRGQAKAADLRNLAQRFIGAERADAAFDQHIRQRGLIPAKVEQADAEMIQFVERLLAGAIGAASARVMVASNVKGSDVELNVEEIMEMLDETSQVLEYSRQLEQKSEELEAATRDLQAANEQLKELDRMKDEFLSTVTHELRTPLTSIRSFSEILHDSPDLDAEERQEFLAIIIRESERLTRLINRVLDLAKMESGRMEWQMGDVDLREIVTEALATLGQVFENRDVELVVDLPDSVPVVHADRDRLVQVVINLLSNAEKFCDPDEGRVEVALKVAAAGITCSVADNGHGIPREDHKSVFEKFHQVGAGVTGQGHEAEGVAEVVAAGGDGPRLGTRWAPGSPVIPWARGWAWPSAG